MRENFSENDAFESVNLYSAKLLKYLWGAINGRGGLRDGMAATREGRNLMRRARRVRGMSNKSSITWHRLEHNRTCIRARIVIDRLSLLLHASNLLNRCILRHDVRTDNAHSGHSNRLLLCTAGARDILPVDSLDLLCG